jgi:NAD(P)-dependent dehydrogenase (short-subunit alcohol dehydrogenase family)
MNNAGVMALPLGTTKEGFETQLGTNHVGPALLTRLLMPTLLSTAKEPGADVRIINLASEAHVFARSADILLDESKLNAQTTWVRYGYSKLANILYTQELAVRYPGIKSVAIHPGVIKTDLWIQNKHTNVVMDYIMAAGLFLIGQSVEMGARNQLWAATCKKEEIVSGRYYKPIGILSKGNLLVGNSELAKGLWEWTEKELEERDY